MTKIKREVSREIKFTTNVGPHALGSVIVEFGQTKVYVTAIVEEEVPRWLKGQGKGWLTAEYAMLPSSTGSRVGRERKGISGRSQEIQRFIGRGLRNIVDLEALGERTILIDCDVLVADGGTRTASLTGAYVALKMAVNKLLETKKLQKDPLKDSIAAVSVGVNSCSEIIVDLDYSEDSSCEVDMNIVMTGSGKFVEIQGGAEGAPISKEKLHELLDCGEKALKQIFVLQQEALN